MEQVGRTLEYRGANVLVFEATLLATAMISVPDEPPLAHDGYEERVGIVALKREAGDVK